MQSMKFVVRNMTECESECFFQTIRGDWMVGPLGVVVSPFRPTSRIEGGPHHHVEAARRWCRYFLFLLLNAAKASIPFGRLGRSPKAWWSEEAELAVRDRWGARSEAHRLAYVQASRRASSVISMAKTET